MSNEQFRPFPFEFQECRNSSQIREHINSIESHPLWPVTLIVRTSIQRLTNLRGRLPGEESRDFSDLMFDLHSCRGQNISKQNVSDSLQLLTLIETMYYRFGENLAVRSAREYHPERLSDYIDVAKELIAWQVWVRWNPDLMIGSDGLHNMVMNSLRHLPEQFNKIYLSQQPSSYLRYDVIEHAKPVDFVEKMAEMPIYRLRRSLDRWSLPEIFSKLAQIDKRERLALLVEMGYIPNGENLSQASKNFKIEIHALIEAFDRGLDTLVGLPGIMEPINAQLLIDECMESGLIRDPNGKICFFNSPRLRLLELTNHGSLTDKDLEIYRLARELNGQQLTYSLDQIAKLVGLPSNIAVAKRIKRIVDSLENN